MGTSIDPYFYKTSELLEVLKQDGADDEGLLRQILAQFGNFIGDYYFLLNNEHNSYGNPFDELAIVLNAAFSYSGAQDGFFDSYLRGCEKIRGKVYAPACDVAERLGIELRDD